MVKKGQTIENKVTGEIATFKETARDSGGKRLRFFLQVRPKGAVAVKHVHPSQDEKFEMKKGKLNVEKGNDKLELSPGESLLIPKGVSHYWWNESDTEMAELDVEVTPAGNMDIFLEQYFGLANDDKCDKQGKPSFLQIMSFSKEYDLFIAGPPIFLQRLVIAIIAPLARMLGYKKYYPEYSGPS